MSNISSSQFGNASNIEEQQRRRFKRKRESGFVGNGYWYGMYPYIVGTLIAGSDPRPEGEKDVDQPMSDASTASTSDGSGMGGTAAGFVGGLGS